MALHPRAQVKLLRYLERLAKAKSFTVIFSTHSVTLLKIIERKNIIYLEKQENGEVRPIYGCFPTYAIGNIASDEETLPDIMIYVEDLFARDVSQSFFEKFANDRFAEPTERPSAKIVPVGGFKEVVAFLERNRSVLPDHCIQRAVLDEDVSSETVAQWTRDQNHTQLAKLHKLRSSVSYLPFTPEVGMMNYAADHIDSFEQAIRVRFGDNQIRIGNIIRGYDKTLQGKSLRVNAKRTINEIIEYISRRTQSSHDAVRDQMCGVFAASAWKIYKSEFSEIFGKMIR